MSILYDVPGPKARARGRLYAVLGLVVIAAIVGFIVWQFAKHDVFDKRWMVFVDPSQVKLTSDAVAADVWKQLLIDGLLIGTLKAAALAMPIAVILGFIIAVARATAPKVVGYGLTAVVEVLRGLPVVLMMFFGAFAFGLPTFWAVVIGLVLYNAVVIAEIVRAGMNSLPRGQREAGMAIGLTPVQTSFIILLPQAIRAMLPSIVAQLVVLLKDSSLGFILGYEELLTVVKNMSNYFGFSSYIPLFAVGALVYISVNLMLSYFAVWLERRLSSKVSK